MAGDRCIAWGLVVAVIMIVTTVDRGFGQTPTPSPQRERRRGAPAAPTQSSPQPAGSSAGQAAPAPAAGGERELTLEGSITGQPEKPLIQLQRNRPSVKFSEVRIGPTSRSFISELLKAKSMEVSSPDIRLIFQDLFK